MNNNNNHAPEWSLSELYSSINDKKIISDLKSSNELTDNFSNQFKTKISDIFFNDESLFLSLIKTYEKIQDTLGKISTYAFLNKSKYSSDSNVAIFFQNTMDEITNIDSKLMFLYLEIKSIDREKVDKKLKSNNELAKYSSWFRKIFLFEKHYLTENEEKILFLKESTSSRFFIRIFDEFFADLRFEFRGEILTDNQIFYKLSSSNEDERKDAGISIGKKLAENGKFLALIINMVAKDRLIDDEIRKFEKPISFRNLMNNIDDEIVQNLILAVKGKYKTISNRYYKLKAKLLKKEKLNFWDRNAPIFSSIKRKFSWNESKEIVLKAFNKFSIKLGDEARKFFDNNWIDAKIIDGKTSGAFCHPCSPSVHPYMLMNFNGDIYDIMTLAHELGHCVHYMFSKNNGYLNYDIPLTLAETASVFGEQLVFRYLLEIETEADLKKSLIAKKIEDMINTVFRQISFADFEIQLYEKRQKSELSKDEICDLWMNVQRDVLGDAFDLCDEYKFYWSYISHFIHSPFYVYSYAFGDCLVNSLYKNYQNNEHNFPEKYINLLSAGGTKDAKDVLMPFNLDISKKDFWDNGLNVIEELIDTLEKL